MEQPSVITLKIMNLIDDFFPLHKALSSAEIDKLEHSIRKTVESRLMLETALE